MKGRINSAGEGVPAHLSYSSWRWCWPSLHATNWSVCPRLRPAYIQEYLAATDRLQMTATQLASCQARSGRTLDHVWTILPRVCFRKNKARLKTSTVYSALFSAPVSASKQLCPSLTAPVVPLPLPSTADPLLPHFLNVKQHNFDLIPTLQKVHTAAPLCLH